MDDKFLFVINKIFIKFYDVLICKKWIKFVGEVNVRNLFVIVIVFWFGFGYIR